MNVSGNQAPSGVLYATGLDALGDIERDIIETRTRLGRRLDELGELLWPRPAERLAEASIEIANGSPGPLMLDRYIAYIRAHPIPSAVIGSGLLLALLETRDASPRASAAPGYRTGESDGTPGSAMAGPSRPRLKAGGRPWLLLAAGLGAGVLAALLLSRRRDEPGGIAEAASSSATEAAAAPAEPMF